MAGKDIENDKMNKDTGCNNILFKILDSNVVFKPRE
jgi:hypothetical protein